MSNTPSNHINTLMNTIVPLSLHSTVVDSIPEWFFTGKIVDSCVPTRTCELCLNNHLRYQYQIKNRFTGHRLMVGSSCILQFGVPVYSSCGVLLNTQDAKSRLNELLYLSRQKICLSRLKELAITEDNRILANALEYYSNKGFLSPKFAFVVFWRLKVHNIDYSPSFFKIILKTSRFKDDLRSMTANKVHVIWPALSPSQKQIATSYGHTAPVK